MSEEKVIQHCSPTLAGIKSAAMFSTPFTTKQDAIIALRVLNSVFKSYGLRAVLLRYIAPNALIYVYRPTMLSKELEEEEALELLRGIGYTFHSTEEGVKQLKERVEESCSIPHEIGLFLGYPVEDVKGFIENHATKYKCSGCWKVYGDEQRAKCLFETYKSCRRAYLEQYKRGVAFEKLIVSL